MNATPDNTPPTPTPPPITYSAASSGAVSCSECGALVDDDRNRAVKMATSAHTLFHAQLGEVIDGLAVRLAVVEETHADGVVGIALDPTARRRLIGRFTQTPDAIPPYGVTPALPSPIPPFGTATDRTLDQRLARIDERQDADTVRLVIEGPKDLVAEAVDALQSVVELCPTTPIVRDAIVPIYESRPFLIGVTDLRNMAKP